MGLQKKHGELILGLIMLAFGIFYLAASTGIIIKESDALHSAFVPRIIGGLILLVSALQIWRGISELRRPGADQSPMGEGIDQKTVLLTLLFLVLYIALLAVLGFIIASVAYLFIMFTFWTPNSEKKNVIAYAAIAVVAGVGIYLTFRYGLDQLLPQGILKFI